MLATMLAMRRQKRRSVLAMAGQKTNAVVSSEWAEHPEVIGERQGIPIFKSNPSVPHAAALATKSKKVRIGTERRGMIVDEDTGELLSMGGAGFYEFEEVDSTRFVKLFLDGVKQATGLSKSGLQIFEIVYREIQDAPGTDEVRLSLLSAQSYFPDLTQRTYNRGLREVLEKGFLFRSAFEGVFYVNIRFMFNGDRLAFVKGYKRKGAPDVQAELDFSEGND